MLEVALDAVGLALHAAEVPCRCLHKLQLRTRWRQLRDRLLQVCIGHLIGVEFEAVAGQVEDFDLEKWPRLSEQLSPIYKPKSGSCPSVIAS
jgi:hypothetical protein